MKHVAIILLNWNGLEDTLECLSSIANLEYKNYQVIIVDNHSDEDLSIFKKYPEVMLIRNQENYGYCKGNNIGIYKAAQLDLEYCWILNNDTVVAPDSLSKLVSILDNNLRLAAVTNRIDYYYDRNLSWFAGGIFNKGFPAHRGYFQIVKKYNNSFETEYLAGCSFVCRTAVLKEIGGFDENYFCYVEDIDLSMRIRALGLQIGYVDDAVIWHKVSRSNGIGSPIQLYYRHRNMLYFVSKLRNGSPGSPVAYPKILWSKPSQINDSHAGPDRAAGTDDRDSKSHNSDA